MEQRAQVVQDDPGQRDRHHDSPARFQEAVRRKQKEQQDGTRCDRWNEEELRQHERLERQGTRRRRGHAGRPIAEQEQTEPQPDAGRDHQPGDSRHWTPLDDECSHNREQDHAPQKPDRDQVEADREALVADCRNENDADALRDGNERKAHSEPLESGRIPDRRPFSSRWVEDGRGSAHSAEVYGCSARTRRGQDHSIVRASGPGAINSAFPSG